MWNTVKTSGAQFIPGYTGLYKEIGISMPINDKSGFHDPIAVKKQSPKNKPHNEGKSPWDFTCPEYDQRTSNFVNAGTHYGVGHKQPVGHSNDPKQTVSSLPFGRKKTMQDDDRG